MSESNRKRMLPLAAAAAVATLGITAGAAEPTTAELWAQIEALQSKVQQLETSRHAQEERTLTAAPTDATVEQVLRDARKRSQFLAADNAVLGGHDGKNFYLKSDGSFVLKPGVFFQFRNVTNYRDEDPDDPDGDSDLERVRGPPCGWRCRRNPRNSQRLGADCPRAMCAHQLCPASQLGRRLVFR